jgi:hypothetical protein
MNLTLFYAQKRIEKFKCVKPFPVQENLMQKIKAFPRLLETQCKNVRPFPCSGKPHAKMQSLSPFRKTSCKNVKPFPTLGMLPQIFM